MVSDVSCESVRPSISISQLYYNYFPMCSLNYGLVSKTLEKVLSMPEALKEAISFALWYGMAPDGSTLVARDLSMQEIYALEWELP